MRSDRLLPPQQRLRASGAWLCGVLLSLAACDDDGAPLSTPTLFTDSAGITIVTSPSSNTAYATIAAEPVLSIGAIDGPDEVLFGRIASVAVDGAGNLIIADGQIGEIRIFDANGVHLQTYGSEGEGPGEFRRLAGAWPAAEGVIVAVDTRLDRITRFGLDGELLATATLKGTDQAPTIRPIRMAGTSAFLSWMQSLNPLSPQDNTGLKGIIESMSDPLGSRVEHLVRHDLAGNLIDTVTQVPGVATVTSLQGAGTNMSIQIMQVPFSPEPAATASPEGRVAVTAGRSYGFSLHGPDGDLVRIVRLAEVPPVRTDAHVEAWARGSAGGRESPDDAEVEAAMRHYEEMSMPERLPAWNTLLVTDSGETWARRFAIQGAETVRWDVFGAEGSHLGQVRSPATFRIHHIGDGRLTVVSSDDLGVERVEVYEYANGASARSS
ncbi:MAG: 6-bladed beta-propeller [bacterium]|nr:6-bladed beta-propeller [bacterium]